MKRMESQAFNHEEPRVYLPTRRVGFLARLTYFVHSPQKERLAPPLNLLCTQFVLSRQLCQGVLQNP